MIIMLWLDYIAHTSILVILKEHSPYFVKKKKKNTYIRIILELSDMHTHIYDAFVIS